MDVGLEPLPLTPAEYGLKMHKVFSQMITGSNNPIWDDREELSLMVSAGMASASQAYKLLSFNVPNLPTGNTNINDRFSKRHTVADLNIPRAPEAMIQLALRYAMENPFVGKAARVKTDFTCKDFTHRTQQPSVKNFYDDYAIKLRLRQLLPRIVWSLYTVGVSPIYWGGEDGGPIQFLNLINPLACKFKEILGRKMLYLKIDTAMMDAMRDPEGKQKAENKDLYDAMPNYWKKQIKEQMDDGQGKGFIKLEEGSYTVIENRYCGYSRAINTLDGVPLQPAFDALQRYRLLSAGDFAVAWNVKNMLTLISEGDPKAPPKDQVPLDQNRLNKLMAQFMNPDYALTVFCDPTTEVRYVVPPLEVFDPKKYAQVEREILTVMNLPSYMWDTTGNGTFGAAVAETQFLVQEVEHIRMILREDFFRPLYSRIRAGDSRARFAESKICLPEFDKSSLRDQTMWLQNVQNLHNTGLLSVHTTLSENGFDPEWEIEQKKKEQKELGNTSPDAVELNNTPMKPLYEASQGSTQPKDKGGRPPRKDGKGNPADKNQNGGRRPRPSD